MFDFDEMSMEELEEKRIKLQESLEDVQEERMHMLGQTGIHLPGTTVKRYEAEIKELEKKIKDIEALLDKKRLF